MKAQSIYELFVFDGEEFVAGAYKILLNREPDEHGLAYYSGRLSLGYGKENIVAQIAKSPECRPHQEIKDLEQFISNEKRATHWFWSIFTRDERKRKSTQSKLSMLARIRQDIKTMQDTISVQSQQPNLFIQQMGDLRALNKSNQLLNQRVVELTEHVISYSMSRQFDETPHIPDEAVRQCFVEILGHEPESEETIKQFAHFSSRGALKENLMHSEELQHKLLALPEYARHIFKYQIQQQTALQRD